MTATETLRTQIQPPIATTVGPLAVPRELELPYVTSMEGRRRSPASAEAHLPQTTSSGQPTAPLQARGQLLGRERCRLQAHRFSVMPLRTEQVQLGLHAVRRAWHEWHEWDMCTIRGGAVPDGRSREVVSEPSVAKGGHVVKKLVCALA